MCKYCLRVRKGIVTISLDFACFCGQWFTICLHRDPQLLQNIPDTLRPSIGYTTKPPIINYLELFTIILCIFISYFFFLFFYFLF
jgi:hypothetical protein